MHGPHDLGGSGDVVALQEREQLVFLAQVVHVDPGRVVEGGPERRPGRVAVGQRLGRGVEPARGVDEPAVLRLEGMDGMARRHLGEFGLVEAFLHDLHVRVAQVGDLAHRHSFLDEQLLHRRDLRRVHLLDQFGEAALGGGQVLAGVKFADDLLESRQPCLPVLGSGKINGHRFARLPPNLGLQRPEQLVDGHPADDGHLAQVGHPTHGGADRLVFQQFVFGVERREELQQERVGVDQVVDAGLGGDAHGGLLGW